MSQRFLHGDVVKERGENQRMTVVRYNGERVVCNWFVDDEFLGEADFDPADLEHAPEEDYTDRDLDHA